MHDGGAAKAVLRNGREGERERESDDEIASGEETHT